MSLVRVPDQPGLYIGGLRNDFHPAKLAGLICSLLWKFQVQVAKQWVHISFKASEAYAIVDLPNVSVSHYLLTQLTSPDNVRNAYDLTKITFDPADFKVGPKLTTSGRHRSRSRPNRRYSTDRSPVRSEPNPGQQRSPSRHSMDRRAGRFRSRSGGSNPRNSTERPREGAGSSNAFLASAASSPAVDTAGMSRRARRRARRDNPADVVDAGATAGTPRVSVHAVRLIPSNLSQKSVSFSAFPADHGGHGGQGSRSDTDVSSSVSKDASSSCSVSSRDSEEKRVVVGSGTGLSSPAGKPLPLAGGVRRLVREESGCGGPADPVSRSMSERGIRSSGPVSKTSATTSTTGLPLPSHVSVTTSTPGTGAGMTSTFYRLGQSIGRETRHSEFKQGGKAQTRAWLMDTVGKYVCGFLNSTEGGTIYFGVNDSGFATGIDCPQSKEDDYRLVIDDALKNIDPPIFTQVYSVRFIPLMEHSGHISDSLQVLEVEVKEIKKLSQLYVFRCNAFLRRDGSLQGPLKARQVQEWMRMRLERESSSSLLKSQLRDMSTQLVQERERAGVLQQRLLQLESHFSEVKLESKKTRICAVM